MTSVIVASLIPIARKTSDAWVAVAYNGALVSTCLTISHVRSRSVNGGPTIHMAKTRGIKLIRPEDNAIVIQATKRHAAKAKVFLPGPLSVSTAPRAIAEVTLSKRSGATVCRNTLSESPAGSRTGCSMMSLLASRILLALWRYGDRG